MMRKVVYKKYGSIEDSETQIVQENIPEIKPSQVLVQVKSASINPIDWKVRNGKLAVITGNAFPKPLGVDFAGVITKIGASVSGFKVGDEVFGAVEVVKREGALAEYVALPATSITKKPSNITFEQAASIPVTGLSALDCIESIGRVKAGQEVLILGVTGGVGLFALQMAKQKGAHVTGVCSTAGIELAKSLGCDVVIDYTKQNILELTHKYDVLCEFSGQRSFAEVQKLLKPVSCFINMNPSIFDILTDGVRNLFASQRNQILLVKSNDQAKLKKVADLAEKGLKIEIAKTFSLDQVKEAYAFAEKGKFIGKVVVNI